MTQTYTFSPLGDRAIVVQFGDSIDDETFQHVQALSLRLQVASIAGVTEHVPAYTTVTLYYDPLRTTYEAVGASLGQLLATLDVASSPVSRTVDIPVHYGGEWGCDLEFVAEHNRLSTSEVIAIHSGVDYRVHMLGFAPGFPYLGGMSQRIASPRRSAPRPRVPAGSVGIAGSQTGIYSLETPGGWQLIGRTPLPLFCPDQSPPTLLAAGDLVRFRPISSQEFAELQEAHA